MLTAAVALHSTLVHPDQIENHNYVMNVCQSLIKKATGRQIQPKKTLYVDEQKEMSGWFKRPPEPEMVDCSENHHLWHAALGFYNSGFEEAAVLVVDGAGAWVDKSGHEVETIYKASYPCNFEKISQSAAPWHTLMENHQIQNPAFGFGGADTVTACRVLQELPDDLKSLADDGLLFFKNGSFVVPQTTGDEQTLEFPDEKVIFQV